MVGCHVGRALSRSRGRPRRPEPVPGGDGLSLDGRNPPGRGSGRVFPRPEPVLCGVGSPLDGKRPPGTGPGRAHMQAANDRWSLAASQTYQEEDHPDRSEHDKPHIDPKPDPMILRPKKRGTDQRGNEQHGVCRYVRHGPIGETQRNRRPHQKAGGVPKGNAVTVAKLPKPAVEKSINIHIYARHNQRLNAF